MQITRDIIVKRIGELETAMVQAQERVIAISGARDEMKLVLAFFDSIPEKTVATECIDRIETALAAQKETSAVQPEQENSK
jgi:predicted DNA-binding ribbon-helix-helix protein